LAGWLLLGQRLALPQGLGIALVTVAAALSVLSSSPKAEHGPKPDPVQRVVSRLIRRYRKRGRTL
jgi:hypothetical protein